MVLNTLLYFTQKKSVFILLMSIDSQYLCLPLDVITKWAWGKNENKSYIIVRYAVCENDFPKATKVTCEVKPDTPRQVRWVNFDTLGLGQDGELTVRVIVVSGN